MIFGWLTDTASLVGAVLLGTILLALRRKGLDRAFPAFTVYLAAVLCSTVLNTPLGYLYAVSPLRYPWFFYTEWSGDLLTAGLGLIVILEVYLHIFGSYELLRKWGPAIYRWAAAILLLLAALVAWQTRTADGSHVMFVLLVAKRSLRMVQTGLLVILFLCWAWLRMSRRRLEFGIALGYGVYAAIDLVNLAVRTEVGPVGQKVVMLVGDLSYLCPVAIWLAYVLAPQPADNMAATVAMDNVEQWNRQLGELLRR